MTINLPRGVAPGNLDTTPLIEFISSAPSEYKVTKAVYDSERYALDFYIINLAGFSMEDQIVIHLAVSPGTFPQESDFSIKSSVFYDAVTGGVISTITPTLTTTIQ